MKRTLLYSVTLMLIASISLSSCNQNGDYQNKEAHNMQAFYFMDFSRDLINMADIEVTYRLADSHVVIDTLTSDQMESFMIQKNCKSNQFRKFKYFPSFFAIFHRCFFQSG